MHIWIPLLWQLLWFCLTYQQLAPSCWAVKAGAESKSHKLQWGEYVKDNVLFLSHWDIFYNKTSGGKAVGVPTCLTAIALECARNHLQLQLSKQIYLHMILHGHCLCLFFVSPPFSNIPSCIPGVGKTIWHTGTVENCVKELACCRFSHH